jgi:hypothetical protein
MKYSYLNSNVSGVVMSGYHGKQQNLSDVLDVIHLTGINPDAKALKNKSRAGTAIPARE